MKIKLTRMEPRDVSMPANSKLSTTYGAWCKSVALDTPGGEYYEEERDGETGRVWWCRVDRTF